MKKHETPLKDVFVLEPQVFGDDRGWFMESYNTKKFKDAGINVDFLQDNHSFSTKGILRGIHFQKPPHAQGKLVRCSMGKLFDVAVDLRKESETYSKWFGVELSAENKKMLWIPEGFGHAFYALEDCEMQYKVSGALYAPESDSGIIWNDPEIGIKWPFEGEPVLSEKDAALKPLSETEIPF